MDPPSENGLFTDVYSSPIPQHTQREPSGVDLEVDDFFDDDEPRRKKSSKKAQRKTKKGKIEDADEIALWSPAKRQSWEARKTNPNAFYYRHVEPGQVKRTGPWDDTEKEAFMKAIKLHPPTQGKWGLFAMNIPGRVGYQCRNFYHRLLESGELHEDSVPGETLEKPKKRQRTPKQQKKTSSKKKSKSVPETESDEEPDLEQEMDEPNAPAEASEAEPEPLEKPDDKEVPTVEPPVQEEEGVVPEEAVQNSEEKKEEEEGIKINTLTLFSTKLREEDERIRKQKGDQATVLDEITSLDDIDAPPSEVFEAAIETIQRIAEPVKWTPRMKNPWATCNTSKTIAFPHDETLDKPVYEYQCSKIMQYNNSAPLNLLLLSFPAPGNLKDKYLKAVRERLASNKEGVEFKAAIRAYFAAKEESIKFPAEKEKICANFVNSFLNNEI